MTWFYRICPNLHVEEHISIRIHNNLDLNVNYKLLWGSKICLICWYSVIHVPMNIDPLSEWVWSRIVPFWASRSRVVVEHIILFFFRKKLTFRSGRQCSRKSVQCPVWCGDPRGRCQSGYHLMKAFSIVGKHLWICIITRDQLWPNCSVAFAYELIAEP